MFSCIANSPIVLETIQLNDIFVDLHSKIEKCRDDQQSINTKLVHKYVQPDYHVSKCQRCETPAWLHNNKNETYRNNAGEIISLRDIYSSQNVLPSDFEIMPIYSKRPITKEEVRSVKHNTSQLMFISNRTDECNIGLYSSNHSIELNRLKGDLDKRTKTIVELKDDKRKLSIENQSLSEVKDSLDLQIYELSENMMQMKIDHDRTTAYHERTIAEMKYDHNKAIAELKEYFNDQMNDLKSTIADLTSQIPSRAQANVVIQGELVDSLDSLINPSK